MLQESACKITHACHIVTSGWNNSFWVLPVTSRLARWFSCQKTYKTNITLSRHLRYDYSEERSTIVCKECNSHWTIGINEASPTQALIMFIKRITVSTEEHVSFKKRSRSYLYEKISLIHCVIMCICLSLIISDCVR